MSAGVGRKNKIDWKKKKKKTSENFEGPNTGKEFSLEKACGGAISDLRLEKVCVAGDFEGKNDRKLQLDHLQPRRSHTDE